VDDSATPAPEIPSEAHQKPAVPGPGSHIDIAYAMCYEAEMPRLLRSLLRAGASEHNAADAAQHAFTALLRRWGTVHDPGPWLRTVAFRQLLRQARWREEPIREQAHAARLALPFAARIELREEEQRVLAVIRQLPLTQRTVFALYYDDLSHKEIAEILQMEEPAVRQNLARARARLRQIVNMPLVAPRSIDRQEGTPNG
jgi:RNA polymerase sigma factor (sigma-70 family)